jgi:hypothetical protein
LRQGHLDNRVLDLSSGSHHLATRIVSLKRFQGGWLCENSRVTSLKVLLICDKNNGRCEVARDNMLGAGRADTIYFQLD